MPAENCANHAEHDRTIVKLEMRMDELEKRVYTVESKNDVNDVLFKQIFEKLDEIITIIKVNQSRLPNTVWGVGGSVAGGLLVWTILEILKR